MAWWDGGGYWPEYVPVATRIARAKKAAEKLRKKGIEIQPVELSGRKIASSFWGKGWCDHMDSFHDYENRLPRGRSYVRNGSVVHLDVAKGKITAMVAGTEVYTIEVGVELLPKKRWDWIKSQCAGQIASLMDLLKGKLSDGVMQVVASRDDGLFPSPKEIKMRCSCPDIAGMCKHIAAVFYGVGARLDSRPELLFLLRGVDHAELATGGGVDAAIDKGRGSEGELTGADLAEMFGIELVETGAAESEPKGVVLAGVSRVPTAKTRRGRPRKAMGKANVTNASNAAGKTEPSPESARKPQKEKAGSKKKTATKSKTRATESKPTKPKSDLAASLRSATAKKEAKRMETLERLVSEYVASKKEKKPLTSAKSRKGK